MFWFIFGSIFIFVILHLWRQYNPTEEKKPSLTFIPDRFQSYEQVQAALRESGLESSNLIVGIDYTKSNQWTGKNTFGGKSLHTIDPNVQNPYQMVLRILGKTLEVFDDDKLIPVFGFGDITTSDKKVFPFFPSRPCFGFEEALNRYNEITPAINLSGPTSFAPLIQEAIKIVEKSRAYHILVIIADGQVTNEKDTIKAIVDASYYPLSIILVGVGDGPWDLCETFDDNIPQRKFDNFQFVHFEEILKKYDGSEYAFALHALMEVPDQYKAIKQFGYLRI
eukprot:TRINITY_DN12115_c0_g1_i1.p1 TRINITY_DN12115_c0_g1~~TRINITY_DN12115_c0_g1_i1.p1  ORF type:complete len:280 (-),score=57.12 TRINITY_DN12115_c0_g1_i1:14-853(-)